MSSPECFYSIVSLSVNFDTSHHPHLKLGAINPLKGQQPSSLVYIEWKQPCLRSTPDHLKTNTLIIIYEISLLKG